MPVTQARLRVAHLAGAEQSLLDSVRGLPVPVYAIGGLGLQDLETARAHGAYGIAAIRSLWGISQLSASS